MPESKRFLLAAVALAFIAFPAANYAAAQPKTGSAEQTANQAAPNQAAASQTTAEQPSAEPEKVAEVVKTIFAAAQKDDLALFDSVISPDFYMYDGGVRYNGDAIMAVIKSLHGAGKQYRWDVTDPDVHIFGNTAWIAYVNKGSVTDASGTTNLEWLESAVLRKDTGAWKLVFFHSTRVPEKQEN